MGVIVVASNKGGVGKTTIAILLSEELARRGYRVAVVEADEERHIANYLATRENNDVPCNFTLTSDEDSATLGKTIKTTEAEADIVVVDLPGYGGLSFTRAVARANLVLIPMKPTVMDSNSATNAIEQIAVEEDHLNRPIPHRIVLNMVKDAVAKGNAVGVDGSEKSMRAHLQSHGYSTMEAELTMRRGPFVSFYTYAQTLPEMVTEGHSKSAERAWREIRALTNEVLATMGVSEPEQGDIVALPVESRRMKGATA